MERIEDKPEGKLMSAIFRESDLNYYPYIVVEEDSEERRIELMTAIQEVLTTLPFRDKKTLELRFGLLDGRPRTLREVGQELSGITRQGARQREAKALRRLRHPIRSGRLKRFIVLSPEEVNDFRKEINYLEGRNQSLDENNQRLKKILKGCGVTEEELEGVRSEDLTSTTQALKKEREGFEALMVRFPNKRVWNVVRRYLIYNRKHGIIKLSIFKEIVESGEIFQERNIGVKAKSFLKNVLQTIEKEASP